MTELEYCLTTRRKGLQLLFDATTQEQLSDYWDVTIAYEGGINSKGEVFETCRPLTTDLDERVCPDALSYTNGMTPKRVHVHLKHRTVPREGHLGKWLHDCQVEKDTRLKAFHESHKFPGERWVQPLSSMIYIPFFLTIMLYSASIYWVYALCGTIATALSLMLTLGLTTAVLLISLGNPNGVEPTPKATKKEE